MMQQFMHLLFESSNVVLVYYRKFPCHPARQFGNYIVLEVCMAGVYKSAMEKEKIFI